MIPNVNIKTSESVPLFFLTKKWEAFRFINMILRVCWSIVVAGMIQEVYESQEFFNDIFYWTNHVVGRAVGQAFER